MLVLLHCYSNLQQTHMILVCSNFHSNVTLLSLNSIKQAEVCVYMRSVKTCTNMFCAFFCLKHDLLSPKRRTGLEADL